MQFEAFLVKEGLVSPEDIVKAMDRQRELAQPIGKIALSNRMLTVGQVFEILSRQADEDSKFGEAAVMLGFLTKPQVEALLRIQREVRPQIGALLIEMGAISSVALAEAQVRHQSAFPVLKTAASR